FFPCLVGQISGSNLPSPRHHEGRLRDRHGTLARVAMDAVASGGSMIPEKWKPVFRRGSCSSKATGRNVRSVRRSRVVLAPRPWRYVGGSLPTDNGGKKGRFPGEITYKP